MGNVRSRRAWKRAWLGWAWLGSAWWLCTTVAVADEAETEPERAEPRPSTYAIGGYVETYWQWNFNRPDNGITNYRGFDNRHNSFTLSNVALDAQWDVVDVVGRITLQIGSTPSTYYASEPRSPGTAGANESDASMWKYLQQAYVGYRFHPLGHDLTLTAGLFLSPIGPEAMAVRENWTWSRSNLFFGLPFYHTGVRLALSVTRAWTLTLAGYNGWNSVVDNNHDKSVSFGAAYQPSDALTVGLLYFGGCERPEGAPEGQPFRHLFDAHATWQATVRWAFIGHLNYGFEPNDMGTSRWAAGQVLGRFAVLDQLSLAARADVFREHVAERDGVRATPIFWPAKWVTSTTLTVDYHPATFISFRLEYRHDHAEAAMYYQDAVAADGTPNRDRQNTLTLGATAGF